MMKFSWCLLVLGIFMSGCLKTGSDCPYKQSNVVAPANEQQQVEAYLAANNITTATKHSSGMYYQVVNPGASVTPALCNNIEVGYAGMLTNGTVFDQRAKILMQFGNVIEGWNIGLPLIKEGGKIRLFIPPTLGYGSRDVKDGNVVVIPANSVLIFDIELFDVN
jgi:FKBP-type peptidyl-prolyl cis-trans isomerase FkpA